MRIPQDQLKKILVDRLAAVFKASGWRVSKASKDVDLKIDRGRARYVVVVRAAPEPRRALLEAMLADAHLRARALAQQQHAQPLAVVGAPVLSDKLALQVHDYAAR